MSENKISPLRFLISSLNPFSCGSDSVSLESYKNENGNICLNPFSCGSDSVRNPISFNPFYTDES